MRELFFADADRAEIFDIAEREIEVGDGFNGLQADPSSRALMQPGDSVIFKLPAILGTPETEIGGSPEVRVSVSLFRKDMEGGTDWDTGVGDRIDSENTVPLP